MLTGLNIRAEIDNRNEKTGKKIRDAEMKRIPFMLIVGEKEEADNTISVRKQGEGDLGTFTIESFSDYIENEIKKLTDK